MELQREERCREALLWRSDLSEDVNPRALAAAFGEVCERIPGLLEFRVEGHSVLLVCATLRLQLRLSPVVPVEERIAAARQVQTLLAVALSGR